MIDIVDEQLEGVDALLEAAFHVVPFGGGNDAGNQVEREDALGAGGIAVDVEGDAHLEQQPLGGVLIAQQMAFRERLDGLQQKPGMRPGLAAFLNISS